MKRTRKWAFVKQEAERLIELGLSARDIGARLEVTASTVRRWLATGQLSRPGTDREPVNIPVLANRTPEQWSEEVRAAYSLDATDEQLVTMGEAALLMTRDPGVSAPLRLQAMGRFQAVVKQLALVARKADDAKPEPSQARKSFKVVRRSKVDPRIGMMAEVG